MIQMQNYNPIFLPTYRYATFPCDKIITNFNFDDVLREIGKFYFHRPDAGLNAICSLIRDEINREWRLNGLKKKIRLKRVSTTQIKTIRRSFLKIRNNDEKYVRIPFNVVSIFFFIISLLNRIDNENSSANKYINAMNKTCISDYLYFEHVQIFKKHFDKRKNQLTDKDLIEKYDLLNANLTGQYSLMKLKHEEVDWDNNKEYIIQ